MLSLAACPSGTGEPSAGSDAEVDTAEEAAAIMALEREWSSRFAKKDVDWIMDLHADDARQMPPGAPSVVGLQALRAAWEAMANAEGLDISWEPVEAHVAASGDLAYDFGTATTRTPDGGTEMGKYLVVWVRRDGAWRVAVDMFNDDGPAAD
jgi:uncharacterized protein (TIGR02246 family)